MARSLYRDARTTFSSLVLCTFSPFRGHRAHPVAFCDSAPDPALRVGQPCSLCSHLELGARRASVLGRVLDLCWLLRHLTCGAGPIPMMVRHSGFRAALTTCGSGWLTARRAGPVRSAGPMGAHDNFALQQELLARHKTATGRAQRD